jgi:hypothetical protein
MFRRSQIVSQRAMIIRTPPAAIKYISLLLHRCSGYKKRYLRISEALLSHHAKGTHVKKTTDSPKAPFMA